MRKCGFEGYNTEEHWTKFKFQLLNLEIIYECPVSYLEEAMPMYGEYQKRKMLAKMGIQTKAEDIALMESNAFCLIESEIIEAESEKARREAKKS